MSFLISTACVRLKMPGVAKNVLMQLAEMANDHGFAFPSIDYLCMRTCWGRSAVIEALGFLEERKVIAPNRESGRNTTYWVTPENWTGERFPDKAFDPSAKRTRPAGVPVRQPDPSRIPAAPDPSASRTRPPAEPVRQPDPTRPPNGLDPSAKRTLVSINTNELNTPPTPKGAVSGFDEFWKAYPKKLAEAAARKQWNKLAPDAGLQERILSAVRLQLAGEGWRREAGRYVPKASAWLSGERWLDEVAGGDVVAGIGAVQVVVKGSRTHVEQVAAQFGIGPWDEVVEQFPAYKARVAEARCKAQAAA